MSTKPSAGEAAATAAASAFVDVPGAAQYLATSDRHVRELVYRRQIPYFKVGRLVRFKVSDLDNWLNANRVEVSR